MAVLVWISLVFILLRECSSTGVPPGEPKDPCYQTHLNKGRIRCTMLQGEFIFGDGIACDPRLYKDVTILRGRIEFVNSLSGGDPLDCLKNLHTIIAPSEGNYTDKPVIHIDESVMFVQSLSFNPKLNIYGANKIWVSVKARNFRMQRNTYMFLAGKFGSGHLDIPNHEEEGECNLENEERKIKFMNELNNCTHIRGSLVIAQPLGIEHDIHKIRSIDGCISIENSKDIELEHIYFLRNVISVNCTTTMSMFHKTPKLCVPKAFLTLLAEKYEFLSEREKTVLIKNTESELLNNKIKDCETTCTAYELEIEKPDKKCYIIFGDVRLRKDILTIVKNMTTLRGRLLIDGFDNEDPFSVLPNLKLIETISSRPAVTIRNNHYMKRLTIPKDLKIVSPRINLYVKRNYAYKMSVKEHKELISQFGEKKVVADVLEEKECYFPDPIKDLTELDGCETVHGDLVMNGNVTGHTLAKLRKITGCVTVNGTNLDGLPFLEYIDKFSGQECNRGHSITFNTNLCPRFIFERLRAAGDRQKRYLHIVHGNKEDCYNLCNRDDLFSTTKCNSIVEGVSINEKVRSALLTSLAGTEEVRGSIRILRTNATKIDELVSLRKIVMESEGPAIEIKGNKDLETIDFSRLEHIESPDNKSKLVVIRNNGEYIMPYPQYRKLVVMVGEDKVDVDHKPNTEWYGGLVLGCGIALLICCLIGIVALTTVSVRNGSGLRSSSKRMKEEKPLLRNAPAPPKTFFGKLMSFYGGGAKSEVPPQANGEQSDGTATAHTAYLGQNRHFGILKDNESVMHREQKENKGLSSTDNAPVTGRTANLGGGPEGEYVTMPKTAKTANLGGGPINNEYARIPKTARTAYAGGKAFHDPLQSNRSVIKKGGAVTAKTGFIDKNGGNYDGQLRKNASVGAKETNGPRTANTAMLGGGEFEGDLRNNRTIAPKESPGKAGPMTAMTAVIGDKGYDGKLRKNTSTATKTPVTAQTAMIGKKKYEGMEKKSAMENNPVTANVAVIGKGQFKGIEKKTPSALKDSPMTANTAMIANRKYDGQLRDNVSMEKNPVTAMTAKNAGKNFDVKERDNRSTTK